MIYILFTLAFICLILAVWLYKFKTNVRKMLPGNVWTTQDGDIVKIITIGSPEDKYMLKCLCNNIECEYNTSGEKRLDFTFTDDKKLSKHIGTKETHPEYYL